jgi:hypothetical protein
MGHFITGLIGEPTLLGKFSASTSLHKPCNLAQGLAFLPLRDEDIYDLISQPQTEFTEGFNYLSTQLSSVLAAASKEGPLAYIETEYFGGDGAQGAVVFSDGAIAFGPKSAEQGPINEALRMLGVTVSAPHSDEFQAVGLQRHRHTEDWLVSHE